MFNSGWMRLWLVISVPVGFLSFLIAYGSNDVYESKKFIGPGSYEVAESWIASTNQGANCLSDRSSSIVGQNYEQIPKPPKGYIIDIDKGYEITASFNCKSWSTLGRSLLASLAFPALMLVIGLAIKWVIAGFRMNKNRN